MRGVNVRVVRVVTRRVVAGAERPCGCGWGWRAERVVVDGAHGAPGGDRARCNHSSGQSVLDVIAAGPRRHRHIIKINTKTAISKTPHLTCENITETIMNG